MDNALLVVFAILLIFIGGIGIKSEVNLGRGKSKSSCEGLQGNYQPYRKPLAKINDSNHARDYKNQFHELKLKNQYEQAVVGDAYNYAGIFDEMTHKNEDYLRTFI